MYSAGGYVPCKTDFKIMKEMCIEVAEADIEVIGMNTCGECAGKNSGDNGCRDG